MSNRIKLYEGGLSSKTIATIVKTLSSGALVICPTDSMSALICDSESTKAMERMRQMKEYDLHDGRLTMMCADIKMLSDYTPPIPNDIFRFIKRNSPGPFTFILPANAAVQKLFKNKRKAVGVRISNHPAVSAILEQLGRPLVSTSLPINEDHDFVQDIDELEDKWGKSVDWIIDFGHVPNQETTIIDCITDVIEVVREGAEPPRW